jgi:hypothetical protein
MPFHMQMICKRWASTKYPSLLKGMENFAKKHGLSNFVGHFFAQ